jgi:acyl-CoA dehydrogenase
MDRSDLADVLAAVRDFVRKEVVPIEEQIDAEDAIPRRVITTCKEMGASTGSRSHRSTAGSG